MYIGMSNNVTFHTVEVAGTLFLTNLTNSEIRIMTCGWTTISCHHGWLVGSGLLAYSNPIGSFFTTYMYIHICLDLCFYLYLQTRYILPDKAGIIYISYSISLPENCMPCFVCLHIYIIYIYIYVYIYIHRRWLEIRGRFGEWTSVFQPHRFRRTFTN